MAKKAAVAPFHLPEPPMEHWPDDAKDYVNQLNANLDAATRMITEQNRVMQTMRSWLDLLQEEEPGNGGP